MAAFLFLIGVAEVIFGVATDNAFFVLAGALQVTIFGPPESSEAAK